MPPEDELNNEIVPDFQPEMSQKQRRLTFKESAILAIKQSHRIILFKGGVYYMDTDGSWEPLRTEDFARIAYSVLGEGIDRARIADLEHYFKNASSDMSHMTRYIAIGGKVWDRVKLRFTSKIAAEDCIYNIPYTPTRGNRHKQYMLDLAKGDEELANDMLKAIAPVFMDTKPVGVIWFLGSGGNGKSSLVNLVYHLLEPYLASLTLGKIEDGRNAPALNGKIANICRETEDEVIIKNTVNYKAIGTHEPYSVDRFYSQDPIDIDPDLHYIFNTNKVPTFSDKGHSIRRRTLIIPFNNRFKSDVTFEERTFTKEFIQDFLGDLLLKTHDIRENGYEYGFGKRVDEAKSRYDKGANTADTYVMEMRKEGVVGFRDYKAVFAHYQEWCETNGVLALGKKSLVAAWDEMEVTRTSIRKENLIKPVYVMPGIKPTAVEEAPNGLYYGYKDLPQSQAEAEVAVKNDVIKNAAKEF